MGNGSLKKGGEFHEREKNNHLNQKNKKEN